MLLKPEDVTAIILCGGAGQRLGGVEKPLVRVGKRALVEFVIERLRPQTSRIILSLGIGQHAKAYRDFGCDLIVDAEPDQGPLGGLVSCLAGAPGEWFLSYPCDMPRTAPNLVQSLSRDALGRGIAVAHDGLRRQNLCLLVGPGRAGSLMRFYAGGGRAVFRWIEANKIPPTDLSGMAPSFVNINTPADLEAFRHCADASNMDRARDLGQ